MIALGRRAEQLSELSSAVGAFRRVDPAQRRMVELRRQQEELTSRPFSHELLVKFAELEEEKLRRPSIELPPIRGDSHGEQLDRLIRYAMDKGATVEAALPDISDAHGEYDVLERAIRLNPRMLVGPDDALRTLAHELAHVEIEEIVGRWRKWGQPKEEVLAETIATLAMDSVGLDIRARSVPYVSDWGISSERDMAILTDELELVHEATTRLEGALA